MVLGRYCSKCVIYDSSFKFSQLPSEVSTIISSTLRMTKQRHIKITEPIQDCLMELCVFNHYTKLPHSLIKHTVGS